MTPAVDALSAVTCSFVILIVLVAEPEIVNTSVALAAGVRS